MDTIPIFYLSYTSKSVTFFFWVSLSMVLKCNFTHKVVYFPPFVLFNLYLSKYLSLNGRFPRIKLLYCVALIMYFLFIKNLRVLYLFCLFTFSLSHYSILFFFHIQPFLFLLDGHIFASFLQKLLHLLQPKPKFSNVLCGLFKLMRMIYCMTWPDKKVFCSFGGLWCQISLSTRTYRFLR